MVRLVDRTALISPTKTALVHGVGTAVVIRVSVRDQKDSRREVCEKFSAAILLHKLR